MAATATTPKARWNKLEDVNSIVDADTMRDILGFRDVKDGEKGFRYTDRNGTKKQFVLEKNKHNRPFRLRDAQEYADTMFAGLWAGQWNHDSQTGSGESWQIGADGDIVSMAHRGVGLILAQERNLLLRNFGQSDVIEEFSVPENITVKALLISGVDEGSADTTDQPIGRTLGDVLYRKGIFPDKFLNELTPTQRAMITRELATAVRLVWIRLRGQRVTGGDPLPFPEALKFLETHPLIADCVQHIYTEDGKEKKISSYISLGYAAGMCYLMGFSNSARGELEDGSLRMTQRPKAMDDAEKFWTLFGQSNVKGVKVESAPVNALSSVLDKNKKAVGKKYSRDALCVLVCRAWEGFQGTGDRKVNDSGGLTRGLYKNIKEGEKTVEVLDFNRFGGFDVDREVLVENGWIRKEEKLLRKAVGGWKVNDPVWVDDPNPDVQPWFGIVREFSEAGTHCVVESREESDKKDEFELQDGSKIETNPWGGKFGYYEVEVPWLKVDRPAPKAPPAPATPAPVATATVAPKKGAAKPPVKKAPKKST